MTLEIQCTMDGEYTSTLLGLGTGKARTGAKTQMFSLCDNHSGLFEQIDKELVQEGWAPSYMGNRPTRI